MWIPLTGKHAGMRRGQFISQQRDTSPVTTDKPALSILVVVYDMRQQAMNTLHSLSAAYQSGVDESDYEVLVLENNSGSNLDPDELASLGQNFHYYLRREPGVSPAPAINEGLARCNGSHVGLLIDGARMLSPGVLSKARQALKLPGAIVATPGYYLSEQGRSEHGSGEVEASVVLQTETSLLDKSNWREDGYRLFQQACFSNGNRHGYLDPWMECNALFCAKTLLDKVGGADERFDLSGGGALNLHLYRQLATSEGTQLVILPGEGNFHQFHGGTSTTSGEERDALVKTFKEQLDGCWPGGFKAVSRQPTLFGTIPPAALPFLLASANSSAARYERFAASGREPWEDDRKLERA